MGELQEVQSVPLAVAKAYGMLLHVELCSCKIPSGRYTKTSSLQNPKKRLWCTFEHAHVSSAAQSSIRRGGGGEGEGVGEVGGGGEMKKGGGWRKGIGGRGGGEELEHCLLVLHACAYARLCFLSFKVDAIVQY